MPNDFDMAAGVAKNKIEERLSQNYRDALQIARYLAATHFPHAPEWEPLPTLSGVLSQINNMVTAWKPSTTTPTTAAVDRSYADGYNNGFRHGKQSRQPIDYLPAQQPDGLYWRGRYAAQETEVERLKGEVERLSAELKRLEIGKHKWVTCPICKESDVLAYFEGEADDPTGHGWLVHCSNLSCPSNISVHAEENRRHNAARDRADAIGEAIGKVKAVEIAHLEMREQLKESALGEMQQIRAEECSILAAALEQLKGEGRGSE